MSDYLSFLWSSFLFFVVAIPLLLLAIALTVLILSPFVPALQALRQLPLLLKPNDPDRLQKFRRLMDAVGRMQGYDLVALDRVWDSQFGTTRQYLGVIERRWLQGTPLKCEAYLTQAGPDMHVVLWIQAGRLNISGDQIVLDRRVQEQLIPILGPTEDEFLRRVVEWKPALQSLIPLQSQVHGRKPGVAFGSGDNSRLFSYKVVKDFGVLEEMQYSLPKIKGGQETIWLELKADIGRRDDEILVVLDYSKSSGGPVHRGKISAGPMKGQYAVQSTVGEPDRTQYPLGKEGREALRRILASAHDRPAAA